MARGLVTPGTSLSAEATNALKCGNIDELLRIKRREFGGWVMMAKPDDDDDDDADDDDDDDNPAGGGEDGDDDGDDKKDKKDADDDDGESELEKMRKRMRAADKRADEAAAALKKIEDAKKDDLTKATETVTELESKVEELTVTVRDLRLQNAFLTSNKHTWHDPDTALALAQTKKYLEDAVDDEGDVDKSALTKALDRLAKEHGYLVKTEKKKDDDNPDPPSGESGGGRSDNRKDDKAKKKQLQGRFPVLNR